VLQLARDRCGEKPLTWGWLQAAGGRQLVFASELAALRAGTCQSLRTYDMATRRAGRTPLSGEPPELVLLEGA
jgi:asparagine synthetase B (glutamine-hydrolysing)